LCGKNAHFNFFSVGTSGPTTVNFSDALTLGGLSTGDVVTAHRDSRQKKNFYNAER